MKKILLFCLLAALVFSLAGSIHFSLAGTPLTTVADVTITVSAGELNYKAIKPITWIYSGRITTPKFNISMVSAGTPATELPIAQVLCNASEGGPCTFPWQAGKLRSGRFSMTENYRIKVCTVGVNDDCAVSSAAFRIIPPELASQLEVFNLFKKAMGNRYKDLNSDNKSGAQGVYAYIVGNEKIATTTANIAKVYKLTDLGILDWFKAKFLENESSVLATRDKEGIKIGMDRRYSDLCAASWRSEVTGLAKVYNDAVVGYDRTRKNQQSLYETTYRAGLGNRSIVPDKDSSVYNNAVKRAIGLEMLAAQRSLDISIAYKDFFTAKKGAFDDYKTGEEAAGNKYNDCVKGGNSFRSDWGW